MPRSNAPTRYAVVIERVRRNYSAYVPDLPGCVATGSTLVAVKSRLARAIRMHLDGMKEDGAPIPKPTAMADYVVAAA